MPSFWPFGHNDTSAASFEKALSQLSTKITKTQTQTDGLRQTQRRVKVLWTLYTSFAYILVALILVLVTRIDNWTPYEYTAVAGGPVLIYGMRTALDAWYSYRIARKQEYLNGLSRQREGKIEELKKATKYNSTQDLLDKYGGGGGSAGGGKGGKGQASPEAKKGRKSEGMGQGMPPPGPRTGLAPPPTANIPGRQMPPPQQQPAMPEGPNGNLSRPSSAIAPQRKNGAPGEEFAPNAFSQSTPPPTPPQQAPSNQYAAPEGPKWYDRILDVVLGEDETSAKNRLVLICQECRLVNGQAPPGARTLEEVGRWRCSSCQAWNGVESVEKKMLREAGVGSPTSPTSPAMESEARPAKVEDDDVEEEVATSESDGAEEAPPASSTRSKARQRKKA